MHVGLESIKLTFNATLDLQYSFDMNSRAHLEVSRYGGGEGQEVALARPGTGQVKLNRPCSHDKPLETASVWQVQLWLATSNLVVK